MFIENLLKRKPFNTSVIEREKILLKGLIDLTNFHYNNGSEYKKILDSYSFDIKEIKNINDIPFIPVRLFKNNLLKSVSNNNQVVNPTDRPVLKKSDFGLNNAKVEGG